MSNKRDRHLELGADYKGRLDVIDTMLDHGMYKCARWQLRDLLRILEEHLDANQESETSAYRADNTSGV